MKTQLPTVVTVPDKVSMADAAAMCQAFQSAGVFEVTAAGVLFIRDRQIEPDAQLILREMLGV